jgi:hypothetical protein
VVGRPLTAADRVAELAVEVLGEDAARAIRAALDPRSKLDRAVARRLLDAVLPKSRPVPLAVGPIQTAQDYARAMALIVAAASTGSITPAEAQAWQGIVQTRWRSVLVVKAAEGW